MRRYPDRLIGVASVNPWSVDGVMPAVHELRRLVSEYGFKGLKLEPFILDKLAHRGAVVSALRSLHRPRHHPADSSRRHRTVDLHLRDR